MAIEPNSNRSLLERLLGGESLDDVVRASRTTPDRLILDLGEVGLTGGGADRPALVQQAPRHPRLCDSLSEGALAAILPNASRAGRLTVSAGLLLIHDFWDASHQAAQSADDLGERADSAYWHGIAHRREPDPGNAAYWFRRVGNHRIFPALAAYAQSDLGDRLGDAAAAAAARVVKNGVWNPFAMIELCSSARPGGSAAASALEFQRQEMRLLLQATTAAALGVRG